MHYVHVCAYEGQKSASGVVLQMSAILLTETRFLIGLEPQGSPVFAFATLEFGTEVTTPRLFVWLAGWLFFNVGSEHSAQVFMLVW